MVGWDVKFQKKARKDAAKLKSAHLDGRAKRLIAIMRRDPYGNPPPFEKLKVELRGKYSRRINDQHRLVYAIDAENRTITVFSMFSHYGD